MWRASLRDLQWRQRRFLIAVAATALVFSLTLLMSGAVNSLRTQDGAIIDSFEGDSWFVAEGAAGPFTTTTPVPTALVEQIAQLPGVTKASPVLLTRSTVLIDGERLDVNVVGLLSDSLGLPEVDEGRLAGETGEVVADTELSIDVDDTLNVGGTGLAVVGRASGVSYSFGTPTVYLSLGDAQRILSSGQPVANAIVIQGVAEGEIPGLTQLTPQEVREDLRRPTTTGRKTVQFVNVLLWLVAAGIIASILYLSALERTRDFAVMKATGVTNKALFVGLAMQAAVLSVLSALFAAVIAQFLAPGFPFRVLIGSNSYYQLVIVALVIGILASLAGLRRAVRTDPALAFGGS